MQSKRYRVVVSGTEFYLDVLQTEGVVACDVPMVERQEYHHGTWNQARRDRMVHNPRHK